ncbi:Vacuolar-sorting receptor [Seminavis robusta]|uniref:Vacuolar-sorting receptor n=1 Tax=Seminavis robusta TaxID=568900 RepID=A0A9N8EHI1_9STRA|nr:Vacuolar-sorting receptor [Seminavis robusta]|eukprot:Sro1106_g241990.1 Vacuolar-sorting receptor (608) ;mRNA; f:12779-14602
MTRYRFSSCRVLLLLLAVTCSVHGNNSDNNDNTNVFVESFDNFAISAGASSAAGLINPIKLAFWTTPNRDWSSTLLGRLEGLVTRFDDAHLVVLHPHQAVTDHDGECRAERVDDMTEDCLANCVNLGRYCYIDFDLQDDDNKDETHAGLTGADIVEESVRRLCVWKEYAHTNVTKLFEYVALLKSTNCDMSLSDNCIHRVFDQAGIDDVKIQDCFHNSGGVGPQIDTKNDILDQELHRTKHILTTNQNLTSYDLFPHLAINSFVMTNLTAMSDWQIMASVCNAFPMPKPALCDFCLLECPHGNDNHDPTRQCLWDLTCGDDRNLDDWMLGTGPVFGANGTYANNNNTQTEIDDTAEPPTEEPKEDEPEETTEPPPENTQDSAPEDVPPPPNTTETINNATDVDSTTTEESIDDTTLPEVSNTTTNDNNETQAEPLPKPPPANDHGSTPTVQTPQTPTAAPRPKPTPNLPPYMGNGVLPQPPSQPSKHTPAQPPHTRAPHGSSSGGSLAHTPAKKKAPNTTDPKQALSGILVAVLCVSVVIAGAVFYRRYTSGKEFYAVAADREEGGLASTASHATASDLELHVEMGHTKVGSNGYAPPASASRGTWS